MKRGWHAVALIEHPVTPVVAGIIANPASGRDIRRLTSSASVFPTAEKAQMVARLLGAFGRFGIDRVLLMPDAAGIAAFIGRTQNARSDERDGRWPGVEFLAMPVTGSAADSHAAAGAMRAAGVALIAVLGGDGTHRAVARHCGDIPLLTLSTGTNNVFPDLREATVAGIAGALIATGVVPVREGVVRNKVLRVRATGPRGSRDDIALVDVCVSASPHIGSKAIWRGADIREIFVTFAEEDAIGLSALVAAWSPIRRDEPRGYALRCGTDGAASRRDPVLAAPIAPGLIADVAVSHAYELVAGTTYPIDAASGTLALDGEREIECAPDEQYALELDLRGPLTVDVNRTLRYAALHHLTTTYPAELHAAAG